MLLAMFLNVVAKLLLSLLVSVAVAMCDVVVTTYVCVNIVAAMCKYCCRRVTEYIYIELSEICIMVIYREV